MAPRALAEGVAVNRPLRVAHRRAWAALAVIVPALYLLALGARQPPARIAAWPAVFSIARAADETGGRPAAILGREGRWRLRRGEADWSVAIERPAELAGTEVIVSWTAPDGTERTLGALRGPIGVELGLPPGAERGGRLVFRRLAPAPHESSLDLAPGDFEATP